MDISTLTQGIGWVGTFLIIFAYYLVSTKKVDGTNKSYQSLNLFGAICVGINVFYQQAWPAFALQIVWGAIAILTLLKHKSITK
mgnify:CR=1 FL=1